MEDKWEKLKNDLQIGQELEGQVVRKFPFGDFVELGLGFIGLVEIIQMKGMSPEIYREGKYNPLGSSIKVKNLDFRDLNQQIYLSQEL